MTTLYMKLGPHLSKRILSIQPIPGIEFRLRLCDCLVKRLLCHRSWAIKTPSFEARSRERGGPIFGIILPVLTEEQLDELYDTAETPYSPSETERFILNDDARVRASLERIHYHNYELIQHACAWRGYLDNKLPRPSSELPRLLMPGRNAENDAITNLELMTDFFSRFPHGATPRFAIFAWVSRSTFTLLDTLAGLHDTEHLQRIRKSFTNMKRLIAYRGEPRLSRDEFAERLATARMDFVSECTNNASSMALWLSKPKRERDAQDVPLSKRRDDIRIKAVARMDELYESGMTWTEAEEQTHHEMWREFNALGLACSPHNFHRLRYRE